MRSRESSLAQLAVFVTMNHDSQYQATLLCMSKVYSLNFCGHVLQIIP
jgi:hypothetical protein